MMVQVRGVVWGSDLGSDSGGFRGGLGLRVRLVSAPVSDPLACDFLGWGIGHGKGARLPHWDCRNGPPLGS